MFPEFNQNKVDLWINFPDESHWCFPSIPWPIGGWVFYVIEAPYHAIHKQKYKGPEIDSCHLCLRWCIEMAKIACLSGSIMYFASPE